jgi:hypothetical protein
MSLSVCLQVVGSAILICLFAGVLVSVLLEYIAAIGRLRSRYLSRSLIRLFGSRDILDSVLAHPLLGGFPDKQGRLPSYIDPNLLAEALLGVVIADIAVPVTAESLETGIGKMGATPMRAIFSALFLAANKEPRIFVNHLSRWLDGSLSTLAESYKIRVHWGLLFLSLGLAVGLNVDLVEISKAIYSNAEARTATASFVQQYGGATLDGVTQECRESSSPAVTDSRCALALAVKASTSSAIEANANPAFGWSKSGINPPFGLRLLGWLVTSILAALFACIFFDLTKQLVGIRYGLRRPQTTPLRLLT